MLVTAETRPPEMVGPHLRKPTLLRTCIGKRVRPSSLAFLLRSSFAGRGFGRQLTILRRFLGHRWRPCRVQGTQLPRAAAWWPERSVAQRDRS